MSVTAKLTADTNHAFVQLVQQYRDAGKLDAEISRKKEVRADRAEGTPTTDSIGAGTGGRGLPAKTPDETRALISRITTGKEVPSPVAVHTLALQFGLVGQQITDFIGAGGAYVIDRAKAAMRTSEPEDAESLDFPAGELFGAALLEILKQRRVTNRGDAFLTSREPRYDNLPANRSLNKKNGGNTLDPSTGWIRKFAAGGDEALSTKLHSYRAGRYANGKSPENVILTDNELEAVARNLRLSEGEEMRLHIAHDNSVAHIAFIQEPIMQAAKINQVIRLFGDGAFDTAANNKDIGGAAFAALRNMLLVRGMVVGDSKIQNDWKALKGRASNSDRAAALDRIVGTAGLSNVDGMDEFKERVLAEDTSRAKQHLVRGSSRQTITKLAERGVRGDVSPEGGRS